MSLSQDVYQLESLMGKLKSTDQKFAMSLVGAWRMNRRLSQPQQLWVEKLIDRAQHPEPPKPAPTPDAVGINLKKLQDLFDRASANDVPHPRIRVALVDGTAVKLSRAPDSGKNSGAIYITKGDKYYGKVTKEGNLYAHWDKTMLCEEIHDLLHDLAEDPGQFGGTIGRRLKWCIFCSRELTTLESLYYGYGPICAEKWGLPWEDGREKHHLEKFAEATGGFDFKSAVSAWKDALK